MERKSLFRSLLAGFGLFSMVATAGFAQENRLEPSIKLLESTNKGVSAQVLLPAVQSQLVTPDPKNPNQVFTQITVPGLRFTTDEPGKPGVPVYRQLIAYPEGAELSVRSSASNPQVKEGVNLYPGQADSLDQDSRPGLPPDSRFANPPFALDAEAYKSDSLFPPNLVTVRPLGKIRGMNVAEVDVACGQYNPLKKLLNLYSQVTFFVDFLGGSGFFIDQGSASPFDKGGVVAREAMFNNVTISQYVNPAVIKWNVFGEEFLILTPPAFRAAADKLAAWKNSKGIITNVFNVNDGAGSGPDTKEQIDAFIESRYNNNYIRPSYVLLLGDAEFIPPFYRNTSGSATTGTDYPYALLGAADNLPDFAVGRIPVDTLDQANTVVDKVINYEKTPPTSSAFYANATIASDFQCCRNDVAQAGTDERTFVEVSEFARNVMQANGKTVERIYGKTGTGTPNRYYDGTLLPPDLRSGSGFPWNGNTFDISNAFDDGRFLIFHRDHGWEDGWATPLWDTTDAAATTNGDLLPVVFSVNCASGLFDNETAAGDYGTTAGHVYFSETLLRNPNGGAVGVLGDTRNSPSWPNTALAKGFFDAIWPSALPYGGPTVKRRLGDILNHGKLFMLSQVGVPASGVDTASANSEFNLWQCLGDPTLEIWKSRPFRLPTHFFAENLKSLLRVQYEVNGAEITAYQNTKNGFKPIGRGPVIGGVAELPVLQTPDADVPIDYYASSDDGISVPLIPSRQLWTHKDIAIGPDLKSRELWTSTNGTAAVWRTSSTGVIEIAPQYGPFPNRTAMAVAIGPDNVTRLLWRIAGGGAMIQRIDATGAVLSTVTLGPFAGWNPLDISVGPDNNTRLLWLRNNGQINLYLLDPTLGTLSTAPFGPFVGWTPFEIATGPTNRTLILWNHVSTAASLWTLGPTSTLESSVVYGPYAGWKATHLSIGSGDNLTRLLWQHSTGAIYFWGLDSSYSLVFTRGYAPLPGFSPVALATGKDGRSGFTRNNAAGQMSLWYMDRSMNFLFSQLYGPY